VKITNQEIQRAALRERPADSLAVACRSGSLLVLLSTAAGSAAPATLPVPCANGSCGPSVPAFVSSGSATAQQSGKTLTVNEHSNSAVLNWYSFNVSADGKVVFQQPNATSVALNRIYQASPSSIFGSLSANGQIYLVNPNGFVFGPNSTVNVGGLLASSLNISDAVFSQGILNPALLQNVPPTPALASDGRTSVIDAQGNPVLGADGKPIPVQIVVDPGAQLSAASGGRLMLASQSVQNGGSLSAPDGQVVIAAGAKVYLQASSDPALRGLIVEVDSGGTAWNQVTGSLSAPRGNVSMVGLAVNQDGRVSATTTVAANGSVSLVAADTTAVINSAAGTSMQPQRGGNLELGPQSSIDIEPELASTATAVVDQPQLQSSVTLTGQQIVMHSGAAITAPSANVTATALANPSLGIMAPNPSSQLRIDSGASIDVAGSTAQLPVSANIVAVQLNASQLADDPVNRDGFLHGQTVYVDSRVVAANGNPGTAVASVGSAIAAVPQNVAQRTAAGGTISLESEGDVVVAKSATINVSGGQIDYSGGVVATTQLIASNGQTYDIGQANPNLTYVGLINPTFTQTYPGWGVTTTQTTPGTGRYQPGYVQGAPAGTVHVAAPNIILSGDLVGSAVNGPYQRTPGTLIPGGELEIGLPQPLINVSSGLPDYLAPPVQFAAQAPNIVIADGAPITPGQLTLDLPVAYLSQGGFTRTAIYSNQSITLPSGLPLNLAPGSTFLLSAPRIEVDSGITAPSGSLQFSTLDTIFDPSGTNPQRQGIDVAAGVALDVRGLWTNDQLSVAAGYTPTGQTAQAGGTIALTLGGIGGKLTLGDGSALEASGGAWLAANGTLTAGTGGKIALSAGGFEDALQIGRDVALDAFGVQSAAGGVFALTTNRIGISQGNSWSGSQIVDERNAPGGTLQLASGLFSQFGFSQVNLTVTGPSIAASPTDNLLSVHAGTAILATESSLLLAPDDVTMPTGPSVMGFASVGQLPVGLRPAESVALSYAPPSSNANPSAGQITIGQGAGITVDPRGSIALSSSGSIDVEGTLRAPGGQISAVITAPTQSPPQSFPDQGILLGPHAVLDVSGTAVYQPSTGNGLMLGSVLPGGSVELLTQNGNVTTKAGSLIDTAGTNAPLDVINANNAYSLESVGTAGGAVVISSAGTIQLGGAIHEQPGTGTRAPGGSLTLGLVGTPLPSGTREIEIGSGSGAPPASVSSDGLFITAPTLEATGAASLTLQAAYGSTFTPTNPNQPGALIQIDPGVSLSMAESLTLDAPALGMSGGAAVLKAPAVTLTNSSGSAISSGGTAGTGTLSVQAGFIDLLGAQTFEGIGKATLTSAGDLRLDSLFYSSSSGVQYFGGVSAGGNLTLDAARVYPSTLSQFTLTSAAPMGSITIEQNGASPGVPLSAAGSVTIHADQIVNAGTLYVPFGQLSLQATDALTLAPGSVTSVSASGLLVPYGNVQNSSWLYQNGQTVESISAIPARQVSLSAPSITLSKGASVDLRGGGDLYAYEWVPGTGGSTDALANSAKTGLYAILPQLQGQYAAYDPEEFAASGLTTGASVYLAGGAGLPAGVYPLLPARYALLPGAFLVQEVAGSQGTIVPGLSKSSATGTPLVAGYRTFDNTGLGDPLYSAFTVYPGSYGRQLATYQDSYASSFFSQAASQAGQPRPPLPADAGALAVNVTAGTQVQLNILGQVLTAPASGGLAGAVDISAPNIDVVANSGAAAPPDSVQLVGSVLTGWNAGQLLLGGQRSADGTSISVAANNVTIEGGVTLSGQDVTLVAGSTIDVKPGATVASDSGLKASAAPATAPPQRSILLDGPAGSNAALLAVSDTELPIATRASSSAPGGTVTVEAGAGLKSAGAIAVEGPGAITLAGSLSDHGASVSLVTGDIRFGGPSATAGGLTIGPELLATLQQARALRLSATSIDVLANTTLAPTLSSLTLLAGSINGTPGVTAAFGAKSLTLGGNAGSTPAANQGTGQLTFTANDLTVGPGTLALSGFGTATMNVTEQLSGAGTGGLLFGGDAVVNAGVITGSNAANLSLAAPNGKLTVTAASSKPAAPAGLGALVSLSASSIDDEGAIVVPGGDAVLSATQDLSVGSGAVIDAAGRTLAIAGQSISVPGGSVTLASSGTLSVAAGSRIDVSGGAGADAGSVSISGSGLVQMNGSVSGAATGGARGGSFSLDAGQLSGSFDTLAAAVQGGGFSTAQTFRVRSGDLVLGAGGSLTANQVELVADSGNIDVAGVISAPAADLRGGIALFAGQSFELMSSGQLHADSATAARGGNIEIGTTNGQITLDPGSVVSAAGTQQLGTLTLRAPKVGSDDVAVSPLTSANLSGLSQVIVEPVLTTVLSTDPTSSTSLDAPTMSAIQAATSTYMTSATGVITTRLAAPSSVTLAVEPAVELQSAGAVTVTAPLDLSTWRFSGQPVDLTVRAAGPVTVAGTISDGQQPGTVVPGGLDLLPGSSSSIGLVAGADLTSANPLATTAALPADLTIDAGVVITTGTGNINLAASRNVIFGGAGAAVYTTGLAAVPTQAFAEQFSLTVPTSGGNVAIQAGGNVMGSPISQSVSDWQVREVTKQGAAAWGVDLSLFDQLGYNVATLGGGDLAVSAGGNLTTLSAAAADSRAPVNGAPVLFGSGGLAVHAGADIDSSQFYLADGTGRINAGGSFGSALNDPQSNLPVGTLLAQGNSQLTVTARGNVLLATDVNPTIIEQPLVPIHKVSAFLTYGDTSSLSAISTGGNLTFDPNGGALQALLGQSQALGSNQYLLGMLPATVRAGAPSGDVTIAGNGNLNFILMPSPRGQLSLLAGHDLIAQSTGTVLTMSDAPAGTYPALANPTVVTDPNAFFVRGALHIGDTQPVILAAGGDISGLGFLLPKAAHIGAGRDIVNLSLDGQNLAPTDTTVILAGRDIVEQPNQFNNRIEVAGPGALDLLAGRNINLGASNGVTTTGRLTDSFITDPNGSSITLWTGLATAPSVSGFVNGVVAKSPDLQAMLVTFMEAQSGSSGLTFAQAQSAFLALPFVAQEPFLADTFFGELLQSGIAAATSNAGYGQGYAAIDALFPGSRSGSGSSTLYQGDVQLPFSRIYTLSGGDITVVAPGGLVNVGLAFAPVGAPARTPAELGIVTQGAGDVRMFTSGDVDVNSSRVFTLLGGNVQIWSDYGSIDAGRGSKTSISAPPPQVVVDAQGNVTLDFSGAVAGSGIRTINTEPGVNPGNVYLTAPVGTVNAGDAGIVSAGDLYVSAAHVVVGSGGFNAGGVASGVPPAVSGLGAALSGASSAASSATSTSSNAVAETAQNQQSAAPLAESQMSWLDVFVEGFGGENCKPDDVECLKRNAGH
jgi:filamentous hemagglutinin family protein